MPTARGSTYGLPSSPAKVASISVAFGGASVFGSIELASRPMPYSPTSKALRQRQF